MFGRKYPWIVLSSSLLSVIFLLVGEARFSALSAMRGWYFGSAWIMWSIAPGAFFIGIWLYRQRDWARLETAGGLTEVMRDHAAGSGIAFLSEQRFLDAPVSTAG